MAGTIARVSSRARNLARTGLKATDTALPWSICLVPIAQGLGCTNFHGRIVSLHGGVGAAAGAVTAGIEAGRLLRGRTGSSSRAGLAAIITVEVGGCAGVVDDLDAGVHDGDIPAKGLKGHLTALAHGRVTTGTPKIAVIGSGALVGGVLLTHHRSAGAGARPLASSAVNAASSAVVIVAWANLLNLLDLHSGRALKTAYTVSTPLPTTPGRDGEPTRMLAAGTLGVSLAALSEDFLENTIPGDAGVNVVGVLLGTTLAYHPHAVAHAGVALGGASLILANEKVSFSRVINKTPVLVAFGGLGRRR